MLAYESCALGSINVANFVAQSDASPIIDFTRLADAISLAVHFLDNVIDRNCFPLPQIDRITKQTRKIGLGIMGFADLLIALNIPYSSDAALLTAKTLMEFFQSRAHLASVALADKRGVFPAYRGSRLQPLHRRQRNATVTTIAPAGSISQIAGCSPGIEPLYGVQEIRRVMDGVVLTSIHPAFLRHAREQGLDIESLRPGLTASPSIQHVTQIPENLRRLFVTAHDVSLAQHVRMQSVFSDIATAESRKPSICPPPRPKPKWPKPFFSRTDSNAKASPSSDRAAENSRSFPVARHSHVKACRHTQDSSRKLTVLGNGDSYFYR